MPARIDTVSMLQGLALGLIFTTAAARFTTPPARAASGAHSVFRVVTMRGDVLIGLPRQGIAGCGTAQEAALEADRLARLIARDGRITAWRYLPRRGPDGATRLVSSDRVCLMREDVLMLELHESGLPVLPPPAD